jgi:predicted aminopeptidase
MFKSALKLFFQLLLFAIMLYGLIEYQMVIYGLSQGKGQLSIILNTQPIDDVLKDENFPDSLKQKLQLIQEIKQFTVDSIGFYPSNNYSTLYQQNKNAILRVVSACEPYSFHPVEWTFPFLGTVSYKGFFNKKEARKAIYALRSRGYDVDVYSPSGWSTLGWLKDPILSNMLYKSDGQLANLIIHELTHSTLYVKSNVTFNENLANFIGEKGAEKFLKYKYGEQSQQYLNYENNKDDEQIFKNYILKSKDRLDSLYSSLQTEKNELIKKQKKMNFLTEIVKGVNKLPLYKKQVYFNYGLQIFKEKNAFFMAFSRYDSQYAIFEKEYQEQFQSNLPKYMIYLKKKYPSL